MGTITQSTAYTVTFFMADETDDETAETGLSPTVYLSKAGGAFATSTNAAAEVPTTGRGWYTVVLTTTETNTVGDFVVEAEGTGADIWREKYQIVATAAVSVTLTTAQYNTIADHVIRRDLPSVEASSDGDTLGRYSLMGAFLKFVGRVDTDGGTNEFVVYETDGTTEFYRQGFTEDGGAVPVVGTDA